MWYFLVAPCLHTITHTFLTGAQPIYWQVTIITQKPGLEQKSAPVFLHQATHREWPVKKTFDILVV